MAEAVLTKAVSTGNFVIDTITGATGTSGAIQQAVNSALALAGKNSFSPTPVPSPTSESGSVSFISRVPSLSADIMEEYKYLAPNGKEYVIVRLPSGKYTFRRPDSTASVRKFSTKKMAERYIRLNNLYIDVLTYVAPNGKEYDIVKRADNGEFLFRRPDGTVSSKTFSSRDLAVSFIRSNNPPIVEYISITKYIPERRASKASSSRSKSPSTQAQIRTPSAPSASRASTPVLTNDQATVDRARAQAQAQAQAAVVQASPKPVPVAPPADTVTKPS